MSDKPPFFSENTQLFIVIVMISIGATLVIYFLYSGMDEKPTIEKKDYYDILLVIDPINCLVWNEIPFQNSKTENTFTFHWQAQKYNEFPTYTLKNCTTSSNGTHYGLSVLEVDESQIVSLKELATKFKPKNQTKESSQI